MHHFKVAAGKVDVTVTVFEKSCTKHQFVLEVSGTVAGSSVIVYGKPFGGASYRIIKSLDTSADTYYFEVVEGVYDGFKFIADANFEAGAETFSAYWTGWRE